MMKIKPLLLAAATGAAMCLSAHQTMAQNDGGRPDFQNMSPEERRQFFMDRARQQLEVKDDAEWSAIQPLVQKVMDARRDTMADTGFGRGGFGGRRRGGGDGGGDNGGGGGGGGRNGFMPPPSAEREALQKAVDAKAPKADLKAALDKYVESRKTKEAALQKAQDDLRKVLTSRQEAIATLSGWL